jgi:hypothetical protein
MKTKLTPFVYVSFFLALTAFVLSTGMACYHFYITPNTHVPFFSPVSSAINDFVLAVNDRSAWWVLGFLSFWSLIIWIRDYNDYDIRPRWAAVSCIILLEISLVQGFLIGYAVTEYRYNLVGFMFFTTMLYLPYRFAEVSWSLRVKGQNIHQGTKQETLKPDAS